MTTYEAFEINAITETVWFLAFTVRLSFETEVARAIDGMMLFLDD